MKAEKELLDILENIGIKYSYDEALKAITERTAIVERVSKYLDERIKYNNREATLTPSQAASQWHRERADIYKEIREQLNSKEKEQL